MNAMEWIKWHEHSLKGYIKRMRSIINSPYSTHSKEYVKEARACIKFTSCALQELKALKSEIA